MELGRDDDDYEGRYEVSELKNGPVELTDEEARALLGSNLNVPETAKRTVDVWGKGGSNEREVSVSTWDEVCVIDDVKYDQAPESEWNKEKLEHEKFNVRLRVSDQYPSLNQRRVTTDFMDFVFGLRNKDQNQMKEWKATLPSDDLRSKFSMRFMDLQKSTTRLVKLLIATGHKDRLLGGRAFKGFGTIIDIFPSLYGSEVVVTFKQTDDPNGSVRDEVVGYKAVE